MTKGILNRYALVLETVAAAPGGLSLTEIMHATGLPRGTIHRLITGLLNTGFIEPSDGRKVYVLGKRLLRMLHLGTPSQVIDGLVSPLLRELVTHFKETAFLAALIDSEVQSVAMVVPSGEPQAYVQPGRVMPIHAAASAKVVFAYQDTSLVEKVLTRPLIKYTENARIDKATIRSELERVRDDGFAVCREELDPGILSYACPIHIKDLGVIYSVGLVGPAKRLRQFDESEIVANLRRAASEISTLLSSR